MPGTPAEDALAHRLLSDSAAGETASVERVFEESEDLLQFFDREDIRPGTELLVQDVAPFLGTVTLQLHGRQLVIGLQAARRIWVVE